jgi:microcystin degradation protein MlrC
MAWQSRRQWVYEVEPLELSLRRARGLASDRGPVVLLDHCDNCASGGTMDTMTVLGAIIDAGMHGVVAFAVCDPKAVWQMEQAGESAQITLPLGGKIDMPALGLRGRPRVVTGVVEKIADGRFRNEGPMGRGETVDMGRCAILRAGGVRIVVISRQVEPSDIACLRVLGIEPAGVRYLMLKSRVHWRAGLGDVAAAVVECAGTGVCTSDYGQLNFSNLGRRMYPIDGDIALS